jgi:hypothetical protein
MKAILKKEPADVEVEIADIEMEDVEVPEESGIYEWLWDAYLSVTVKDGTGLKDELVDQGIIIDILDPVTADFLDISNDIEIKIKVSTTVTWSVSRSFSEGYEAEMTRIRNLVESVQVGDHLFVDVENGIDRMSDEATKMLNEFEEKIYRFSSPSDFWKLAD